ncbi:hypothetical protein WDD9_006401 [Paenibacillus melissococcoides]|uniref:hypothetical protein n=1 Tax=Paenibacillus TaxID=44249 RepID=UPI001B120AB0|nr:MULTISPECIES: hypothetical protein [Paenibacillus]MEB9895212.1 hypothetical protein [Bacillus cereus]CAH8718562.1 hypothetical protein HTL2_005327 [Paenibacillus melissococcoides]CAH8721559.1 hypothetical protein WDD9_006353 [Paenibacillus melissococcoides]CAH8721660.1 hypothetical protein HTL2_006473 [Paenibacillus melissococcoides]CAH8721661.1 hypothetical protein WDD9_006401 [Paenibacillus melissococcoides]
MPDALERYSPAQRQIIFAYWETIRWTRGTGKISEGIKQREYEYWERYEPSLVIRALSIHIEKYPNIKENYTRGILRNLLKKGGAAHARSERGHAGLARTHPGSQAGSQGKRDIDISAEAAFRRKLGL